MCDDVSSTFINRLSIKAIRYLNIWSLHLKWNDNSVLASNAFNASQTWQSVSHNKVKAHKIPSVKSIIMQFPDMEKLQEGF